MATLSVKTTIADTLDYPHSNFGTILRRSGVALVFLGISSTAATPWGLRQILGPEATLSDLASFGWLFEGLEIANWLIWIVPLASIIRWDLLGEKPNLGALHFRLAWPEVCCFLGLFAVLVPLYLGWVGLFLGLAQLQTHFPIRTVSWTVAGPILLALAVLGSPLLRLSLLVPMGALGRLPDFRLAWAATRGNALRFAALSAVLAIGCAFAMGVVAFLTYFLARAIAENDPMAIVVGKESLVFIALSLFVQVLLVGFASGFLVSLYRQLMGPASSDVEQAA